MDTIAFRVDSSTAIGTGHIKRCLNLARALRSRGYVIVFICANLEGNIALDVVSEGFDLQMIDAEREESEFLFVEQVWNLLSQETDAMRTAKIARDIGCFSVVVDHYGLDAVWERCLEHKSIRVVALDDLNSRTHSTEIVINPGGDVDPGQDIQLNGLRVYSGLRYALIDPRYAKVTWREDGRKKSSNKVLVFMGGADLPNATEMVINALELAEIRELELLVVLGKANPASKSLELKYLRHEKIKVVADAPDLVDILGDADFAIGAGGVAALERFAAGLPSVYISIAPNQEKNCKKLENIGGGIYAGHLDRINWHDLPDLIDRFSKQLLDNRAKIDKTRHLVDGEGVQRICEIIVPSNLSQLRVRTATASDVYTYFDWANDALVRKSSLRSSPIPIDDHISWFRGKLSSDDSILLVFEAHGLPIGQVRFELIGSMWYLNYSIDEIARGRGWASNLIQIACQTLSNQHSFDSIRARVMESNLPSSRALLRAGFNKKYSTNENGILEFELAWRGNGAG